VYAIVVTVAFQDMRHDEADKMLHDMVVPSAKASNGFISGYWLHSADGTRGTSVEVFQTQADAEAALASRGSGPPPGSPVDILTVELMEVIASA